MDREMKKSKMFFDMKEQFDIRDFDRKKELAMLRFELAVKLATLMDEIAIKRHKERCEVLGIKYIEPDRKKLIANRVDLIKEK